MNSKKFTGKSKNFRRHFALLPTPKHLDIFLRWDVSIQ